MAHTQRRALNRTTYLSFQWRGRWNHGNGISIKLAGVSNCHLDVRPLQDESAKLGGAGKSDIAMGVLEQHLSSYVHVDVFNPSHRLARYLVETWERASAANESFIATILELSFSTSLFLVPYPQIMADQLRSIVDQRQDINQLLFSSNWLNRFLMNKMNTIRDSCPVSASLIFSCILLDQVTALLHNVACM